MALTHHEDEKPGLEEEEKEEEAEEEETDLAFEMAPMTGKTDQGGSSDSLERPKDIEVKLPLEFNWPSPADCVPPPSITSAFAASASAATAMVSPVTPVTPPTDVKPATDVTPLTPNANDGTNQNDIKLFINGPGENSTRVPPSSSDDVEIFL